MDVSSFAATFIAKLTTGNPLPQTIRVMNTQDAVWHVRNADLTPWLKVTPNGCFGDGIFSVSVNIYDPSVVIGVQTAQLFVESIDPTIVITIQLSVSAT
jgi:hypothetical protein